MTVFLSVEDELEPYLKYERIHLNPMQRSHLQQRLHSLRVRALYRINTPLANGELLAHVAMATYDCTDRNAWAAAIAVRLQARKIGTPYLNVRKVAKAIKRYSEDRTDNTAFDTETYAQILAVYFVEAMR